jgi:hypothetical protein
VTRILTTLAALLIGAMFGGIAYAYQSTDHHRTITVYWDFQPKQTDKVQILAGDYVTLYKTHPKDPQSGYELAVRHPDGTVEERDYPATFRYISITHDCNLGCLTGD